MSSFISSLINRHTLVADVVKPRLLTLFESENLNRGVADINESSVDSHTVNGKQDKHNLKNTDLRDQQVDDIDDGRLATAPKPKKQSKNINSVYEEPETGGDLFVRPSSANEHKQPKPVNDFDKEPEIADPYFPVEDNVKITTGNPGITTGQVVNDLSAIPNRKADEEIDTPQPLNNYQKQESAEPESVQRGAILKEDLYSQSAYFTKTLPLKDTLQSEAKKPSIKVTIGQIDVKAIPDAQPARIKNKTTEAPRMSLDDYLKMRNSN